MADMRNLQPTCEEYHSDDSEGPVPDSFRRSPGAAAAQPNVAAKRSLPSDLGSDRPAADKAVHANVDGQSDSGYSSHTAATMSSADSAPSAMPVQSPPAAPPPAPSMPPPSPATSRRRLPHPADDRQGGSQGSPRKPLARTGSVSSKRPSGSRRKEVDCTDPNCTKCVPAAPSHRGRPLDASPLDSALDISYTPFDQRSQRSDPAPSYRTPPSPTYSRPPAPYVHGSAVVQPAQTRRRTSSATRRPASYHEPSPGYHYQGYPTPPQEHGPPLSMSAHFNTPQMPPYMMAAPTPNFYPPGAAISPPYEHQRPPLSARNSQQYQPRGRPLSGFGPALITYDQPMPSARYHPTNIPQSAREPRFPPSSFSSESSESESSEEEERMPRRNSRALMPPPQIVPKEPKERRPSLRHRNTTQVTNERRKSMSQSQMLPERPREADPRASRVSTAAPSRSTSVSRRPLIQHAHSAQETARANRILVENSRSRRQEYQAYDDDRDAEIERKRRNRRSTIVSDSHAIRDDAIMIPERSRRRTDAATITNEYIQENKARRTVEDAEAYQQRTRGSNDPLADSIHKAAKRASRVPSGPSDGGSSHSGDRKTRVSQARTQITNGGGNGEIRLRVDATAPLSLSFNGDMEGRTLQLLPAEDGMADIVIGSARGNENQYRSEKGSILGRKSQVAGSVRREAEEVSIRSNRSSQGRRLLRRRRDD